MTSDDTVPCSLPVATEPASVYRGLTPHSALEEFLICTWTLETLGSSVSRISSACCPTDVQTSCGLAMRGQSSLGR